MAKTTGRVLDGWPGYSHVLLFRHGRTTDTPNLRERDRGLSAQGTKAVEQVARRLAEHLSLHKHELEVVAIIHGEYRQVRETADLLRQAMQIEDVWPAEVQSSRALNPDMFWKKRSAPEDVAGLTRGPRSLPHVGRGLLLIGHEPQLGIIAGELLRWGRSGQHVTPSAAVSCIQLGAAPWRRPRVLWVIEPTDDKTAEQLRQKIASKMDVAKVFGGVVILAVGILLNLLADPNKVAALNHPLAVYFATAALAIALVLYVTTLYAYDSLLMPTRFWTTAVARRRRRSSVVERPPSSANLVLQQNMVHIWNRQFTVANVLVIAGFGLLAWGVLKMSLWWILIAAALTFVAAFLGRRVDLGTQD